MTGVRACAIGAALAMAVAPGVAHAAMPGSQWAPPSKPKPRERPAPKADPGTLLVRFKEPGIRGAAVRRAGASSARTLRGGRWSVVSVPHAQRRSALRELRRDPAVAEAQPNYLRHADAVPDDALIAKGRQGWIDTLHLPAAWDRVKATHAQVIAVLDTGVDLDQPDLQSQLLPGRDVVNDDARPGDDNGHGTATASIAAARANDGLGVAGVAWDASVLPVKVLDTEGTGTDAWVIEGITWAADHGADVINLSLGAPGRSAALDDAVAYARGKGAVVVASAGNDGFPIPQYPAASPGAIAVGATDWSGALAWYSNTGPWVDLAAPGHRIWAARPAPNGGGRWLSGDGTSFSSPVVAGIAALVVAQHPTWTPAQVEQQLLDTALDAGPEGRDPWYGAGVVDALAATGGALPAPTSAPADADSTPDRARPISILPGAPTLVNGRLDREGDEDWYSIDLPGDAEVAMTLYPVEQQNVDRAQAVDGAIDIYNPSLQRVYHIDYSGMDGVESFDEFMPGGGRWYFRISTTASSRSPEPYTFGGTYVTRTITGRARLTGAEWYPTTSEEASTAVGDVTGDGRPEVLMTTSSHTGDEKDWTLFVYQTGPEGELLEPDLYDTGAREMYTSDGGTLNSSFMGVVTGDFDRDGKTDAAVAAGRWIVVFPQRDGRLGAPVPIPGSQGADQLEAADVDGDGKLDLVAGMNSDNGAPEGEQLGVVAFLQRPSGWERRVVSGWLGVGLAAGDVSGDGRTDVVGAGSQSISIARQRADGTFAVEVIQDDAGEGAQIADVTGDGRADVITTSGYATDGTRTLDVRAQTATGGLAPPSSSPIYYPGKAIDTADFDRDGRRDVLVLEDGCYCVGIFLARAGGGFAPEDFYTIGDYESYLPGALSLADLDGDGWLDVVAAGFNAGLIIARQVSANTPRPEWIRDTTPPDGATGVAGGAAVTVRFGRALDPSSAGAAWLEDARGAAVASTASYDGASRVLTVHPAAALPAGAYAVRLDGVRDTFGASPPAGTVVRFTVGASSDTVAPDTAIAVGPSGSTRSSLEPYTQVYASEPLTTFQCSFDTGPWSACGPDKPSGQDMPSGTRTFRVRAVDGAGHVDPTPATRSWTIDWASPAVANDRPDTATPLTGTSGTAQSSSQRAEGDIPVGTDDPGGASIWFRWTAPAAGTVTFDTAGSGFDTLLGVFAYDTDRLGGGITKLAASDDPGPRSLAGRVQVSVRAGVQYAIGVDGYAGQRGAVSLAWSFTAGADTTPPQTTITDGPRALVSDGGTGFAFEASEPESTFECALDGGGWFACESPRSFTFWAGQHALLVRATDSAGNTDATPASWTWSADLIAPEARITIGPGVSTTSRTATFAFVADEPDVAFECRLDRAAWTPCTTPHTVTVSEFGPHEFDVRGTDPAGHTGDYTRAIWVLLADDAPPETTITAGPAPVSRLSTARLSYTSSEPGSFECKLDAGAFGPCPASWGALAPGSHTIAVRARDAADNVDATPAARTFVVDTAAPVLGDFNADGWPDLATGLPGEATGSQAGSGAVVVLPGGPSGPVAAGSALWSQRAAGVPGDPEAGDGFGSALAIGDFDADGYDDLAIGVPGEDAGAGAVNVLRGSPSGLTTQGTRMLVAPSPAAGARFGAALTAARFDVGETEDLAVGMPGAAAGGFAGAGAVAVVPGSAHGPNGAAAKSFDRSTAYVEGNPSAGDGFGSALASGDIGGDTRADLAVGVPGDDVSDKADAGSVNVLLSTSASGIGTANDSMWAQGASGVPDASEAGDRFGAAVAIGAGRLAIGAPGENGGAGAVTVLTGTSGVGARVLQGAAAGDGFGAVLAATRPRGSAPWLAVAAPGDDVGAAADAGSVTALPLPGLAAGRLISQDSAGVPDTAEAGDRLGSELGPLGGALAAGAPSEDVGSLADAGAIVVLPAGSSGGPEPAGSTLWHQEVAGVVGASAAGERLGFLSR